MPTPVSGKQTKCAALPLALLLAGSTALTGCGILEEKPPVDITEKVKAAMKPWDRPHIPKGHLDYVKSAIERVEVDGGERNTTVRVYAKPMKEERFGAGNSGWVGWREILSAIVMDAADTADPPCHHEVHLTINGGKGWTWQGRGTCRNA
ncbi:hypothetical protein ACH4VR_19585 [Streptomyces sp. NPDC020883]|uniref:hypothetical protein n=1 Tax=Streptomyces sp. NPDC020883 TaxID=3365099 RepID=UPI0037BCF4D4